MAAVATIESELIASARPYAMRIVSIFCRRFGAMDRDETESNAMLGLLKAARKFDRRPGRNFAKYARKWVIGEICSGIERESKQQIACAELRELARSISGEQDPAKLAAASDEAAFVKRHIPAEAYARPANGVRRLSATSLARECNITLSAAAHRIRRARAIIHGELVCLN